jgi:uncharacterized protein YqgC (DUF456 family)
VTNRNKNKRMTADWLYYVWAVLLILGCGLSWLGTLVTLPGNWGIVLLAALFVWLVPGTPEARVAWSTVGVLLALAALGELVEAFAGAAGAAKQGASRRGMILSLVGAVVGSIGGMALGVPIPVIGSAVAAVVGGAAGAFIGAAMGEHWKGRPVERQMQVGRAALFGRLWGTVAKLAIGLVMLVLVAADVLT